MKLLKKILQDSATYILTMGPWTLALLGLYFIYQNLLFSNLVWIFIGPIVFISLYILAIFVLRLCLPKLKKGVYVVGLNKGFLTWYFHSMLSRSGRVVGLHYFLHSFSLVRFFYWRALGAKVSFFTDTSYKIVIHDYPLIEIGENCMLAEDVELSGHLITGDRLLVAPVKISSNVFVGRTTYIGPRTTIGENSWIGMGHYIHNKNILPNTKLESISGQASSP
jgi:serine acetyltransferase